MSTAGGLADLHPEPGPGRAASDDDPLTPLPEDDSSVISLPPLATFTRGDAYDYSQTQLLPQQRPRGLQLRSRRHVDPER